MTEKAKILFVDDEKRVLNSMRGLFRREHELFLTTEGATAIRLASENDIDVVVADQRMPGMNGTEVLGRIKQVAPRTVRILLTGYADPSAVEGSINIGEVFRFLSKPCPPAMLRETLQLAIAAARTNRSEPQTAAPARPAAPAAPPAATAPATTSMPPATPHASAATPSQDEKVVPLEQPVQRAPGAPPHQQAPAAAPPTVAEPDVEQSAAAPETAETDGTSSHWQSVTEVVLVGDTSREIRQLREIPDPSSQSRALRDIGVVMFTIDSELAELAVRTISGDRNAIIATSLTRVIEAMEQNNVGVLVVDYAGNKEVLQKMISALKGHLPALVTVVISNSHDTTEMIDLINHGRVFRYTVKPVEPEAFRQTINAAAAHHLYLRSNPELAKHQEAVSEVLDHDGNDTMTQIVHRIRNIQAHDYEPVGS